MSKKYVMVFLFFLPGLYSAVAADSGFVLHKIMPVEDVYDCRVAFDANNLPVIIYNDRRETKLARYADGWYEIETLPQGDWASVCDVEVDEWGNICAVYGGYGENMINSVQFAGGPWTTAEICPMSPGTRNADLELTATGVPHMAYKNYETKTIEHAFFDIKHAQWFCVPVVDVDRVDTLEFEITGDGELFLNYSESDLVQVGINDGLGWYWLETLTGGHSSLAVTPDGAAAVSFLSNDELVVARHLGPAGWLRSVVYTGPARVVTNWYNNPKLRITNTGVEMLCYVVENNGREELIFSANLAGLWSRVVVDSAAKFYALDMVIDKAGEPLLVYQKQQSFEGQRFLTLAGMGLERTCPADLDNSGRVDYFDYHMLARNWQAATVGDLNGDGTVNAEDLCVLGMHWLWDENIQQGL